MKLSLISGLAIIGIALSAACTDLAILAPDPKTDPCGVGGPICSARPLACCAPHYLCGQKDPNDYLQAWCPPGRCCQDPTYSPAPNADGQFYALPTILPQKVFQ